MTIVSGRHDISFVIYQVTGPSPLVGTFGDFTETAHPATCNTVDGWRWNDRVWPVDDNDYDTTLPLLMDADLSLIPQENFQSGTGSDNDLKLCDVTAITTSGERDIWAPILNHGFFYDFNEEDYFFSDGQRSTILAADELTTSGYNTTQLEEFPKPGIPIIAHKYSWDDENEEYNIYTNYKKRSNFTGDKDSTGARKSTFDEQKEEILFNNIDQSEPEFIVIYSGEDRPPHLIFNNNYTETVGSPVSSGDDLANLELLGISNGKPDQIFHTDFAPIDSTSAMEVWTWTDLSGGDEWTILTSGLVPSGQDVILDRDDGTFRFGDGDNGDIPASGVNVGAFYTHSVQIRYEPENTTDKITAARPTADTNPVRKNTEAGFVLLERHDPQPASITLTPDANSISLNLFGPVNIGNVVTQFDATVTSKNGTPVEGVPVTFEILDNPSVGNWTSGSRNITAISDTDGVATTFYSPPATIDEISELVTTSGTDFTYDSGNTVLNTELLKIKTELSEVHLYKVFQDDPVLGIDLGDQSVLDAGNLTSELEEFYRQFFEDEDIFGPTGLVNGTTVATSGSPEWENRHRLVRGLLRPKNYNRALRNGRKQVVSVFDKNAINPHVEESGAFVPLRPDQIDSFGNRNHNIIYSGILLEAPGTDDLDSYMVVAPTSLLAKAIATDEQTGARIESDIVELELTIPGEMNGTLAIDDINSIPSGIVPYLLGTEHNDRILPLGWKLRSEEITIASALNAVTYIDINPKPQLGMAFTVINT